MNNNSRPILKFSTQLFAIFGLLILFTITNYIVPQIASPTTKKKGDFISQDDREAKKIKQLKVKTRTTYASYYDKKGQLPENKTLASKEFYNKDGLLTGIMEYNGVGKLISAYKFSYDSKGNPTKAESSESGGKSSVQISKYDSHGNEIERRLTGSAKKKRETKSLFKYDKNDNLIEAKNYSGETFNNDQIIEYKNGKKVSTTYRDAEGKTILVITPEYDSAGKLIKEVRKDANASVVFTYKYDAKGNLSEMVDNETKRYYSSDEKGNVIEHKMYLLDGRRQLRIVFKYGDNGLQTEQIRYDNDEKPVLYTEIKYEYYK